MKRLDAAVVGGGVIGLCAAWALAKRGLDVALFEAASPGHSGGSSHSQSRITRTAYVDPVYVALMRAAHTADWPALERDLAKKLVHPTDVVVYGPPEGAFHRYAAAIAAQDVDVLPLSAPQAGERFPQLRFEDAAGALWDRTGGVLAAADTIQGLTAWLGDRVRAGARVEALRPESAGVVLETSEGAFRADRVVVAAGPWSGRLLPALGGLLRPVRQDVAFLDLDLPPGAQDLGAFPAWYHLGPGVDGESYGLPAFGRPGVKIARYAISGHDDPDAPRAASGDFARPLAEARLRPAVRELLAAEGCWFTMAPNEDPVIDLVHPRVAVFAGGSGHSFKLGPLAGRLLAGLLLDGAGGERAFDEARGRFGAGRAA